MQPLVQDLKNTFKSLTILTVKSRLNHIKIDNARRQAAYLENKGQELRRLVEESETTVNQIKDAYANIKGQAKATLQKAKGLSKGFNPDDEGFAEFRDAYERLSSDFDQLQEEKVQLNTKIDCLNIADDDEMREYEESVEVCILD